MTWSVSPTLYTTNTLPSTYMTARTRTHGGAENAGVENAGVENAGAITYGKPSSRK